MKTFFTIVVLLMCSVISSYAQKAITLSQIRDTEWCQVFDTERTTNRIVRISTRTASWSIIHSGTQIDEINEEYYLTNEEPILRSDNDGFLFDHSQVGNNQKGKYIMVYDKKTETTKYFIVKDYNSTYIYLEVPASYLIHKGEKVYLSESWIMTLKKR